MYTKQLEFSEDVRTIFLQGGKVVWQKQSNTQKVCTVLVRMPKDQWYADEGNEWEYVELQDIFNHGTLRVATLRNGTLAGVKKLAKQSHSEDVAHEYLKHEKKDQEQS